MYITNKWLSLENMQMCAKETFTEALKVVDKPLKVINCHN